ncbi:hypothetical protein [Emticicia soli]|uniref:Anti-sigma factor n=1 Tax=Emticicia soli TaxID=2027878 RepID=A0ABW5J6N2_9BACT
MQAEEFYNKIRENLDNSDFTPEWNKSEVWQRIERKDQKKAMPLWWKAVAAGIVMASALGGYLFFDNKAPLADKTAIKKQVIAKPTQQVSAETSTPLAEAPESNTRNKISRPAHKAIVQPVENAEPEPIVANEIANEEFDNMVTTEGGEQEFSYNNVTSRNEPAFVRPMPILFRPNNNTSRASEKPAEPVKRERVAILEIPEEQEDFVIVPKDKKKNRNARLAKQTEKIPEATDPNKPNKIWAFVKQSFKNETMPADSTLK